ncbi:MAG: hypothetical protein ACQEXQ_19180 [Bacillota bacterium]
MKLRYRLFFIAVFLILTGCSIKGTDSVILLNLDQVEHAFRTEGIKLDPKQITDDWKIRKVKANRYVITNNEPPDQIFIYIFDSEEARKDGRKDFDKQKEKTIHDIYENKNVLVIYWYQPSSTDDTLSKTIQKALQKL